MKQLLIRTLMTVALLAGGAALAGLIAGETVGWLIFCSSLVVLLFLHVSHAALLARWLSQPESGDVPGGLGMWSHLFSLLHRLERTRTKQIQQLTRLLVRFRQAGRALPDGVVILDANNRIEWCNDTAETHFNLSSESDVGQPVVNLVRQPEFVAYLEGGDYARPVELRASRGAGTALSIQIIPYGDAQKLLLSRDITRLEKLETIRRDFVANVSHELRTPLTVLSGFLDTIRELDLDRKRSRDYLNLMAEQSRRMHRIVDDLLTLSTLESTRAPSLDEQVKIEPLLEKLRAEAEALSGGRHRIVLDMEPGYDLLGAENEITSAFSNLVSNAVRYTPTGGEVELKWRANEDGAEFSVRDNGIGIAAEHIPRLTERFYRIDRGRSRETGGTGLGLAIVKHVLGRHDATLQIVSDPGRGSCFTARFSARRAVPAKTARHDAANASPTRDMAPKEAGGDGAK